MAKGLPPRVSLGRTGGRVVSANTTPHSGVQEFKGYKQRVPPECESVSCRAPACVGHPWSWPSGDPPGVSCGGFLCPKSWASVACHPPHTGELLWALLCPGLCCPCVALPRPRSVTCLSEAMEFSVHCAWQVTSRFRVLGTSKARGLL